MPSRQCEPQRPTEAARPSRRCAVSRERERTQRTRSARGDTACLFSFLVAGDTACLFSFFGRTPLKLVLPFAPRLHKNIHPHIRRAGNILHDVAKCTLTSYARPGAGPRFRPHGSKCTYIAARSKYIHLVRYARNSNLVIMRVPSISDNLSLLRSSVRGRLTLAAEKSDRSMLCS